jgi:hypothetical protein
MGLTYHQFRNPETGQLWRVPAGRYGNFISSVMKLVNYIRYNIARYYFVHLTLTVAENVPDINCDHLHRVLQFISQRLKRVGSDFKYIAVKELQERGAIHFHILCVYSKPYVFPSSNEIASSWGLGFVKITAPKIRNKVNRIAGYIGKYIGKGYEYETLDIRKSFTASQIRQIYKLKKDRLDKVMERFGKTMAERMECSFRKVYLVGYEIVESWGLEIRKRFRKLVMEFPLVWIYEGIHDAPF